MTLFCDINHHQCNPGQRDWVWSSHQELENSPVPGLFYTGWQGEDTRGRRVESHLLVWNKVMLRMQCSSPTNGEMLENMLRLAPEPVTGSGRWSPPSRYLCVQGPKRHHQGGHRGGIGGERDTDIPRGHDPHEQGEPSVVSYRISVKAKNLSKA